MREIKFRGRDKRYDGTWEPWMYGSLDLSDLWPAIIENGPPLSVQRETVGQYIGLKDDNGVKIYEGDVVKVSMKSGSYSRIQMSDQVKIGVVKYSPENTRFSAYIDNIPDHAAVIYIGYGLEVLGNVFDDPELEKKFGEIYMEAQ